MKAKIISTGEIVKIVSSKFEMGYVTVLREDKKFTNVASDEIEMIGRKKKLTGNNAGTR